MYKNGWNVTGESDLNAVGMSLNFTLWAFIGVESASVSTAVMQNPTRNVPIATVGGVLLAAVCYVLSSTVIMGLIPSKELIASSAPFSDAVAVIFGPTAGHIVALCAAIGCLGSLAGWTLLVGQTAQAAAEDGLFGHVFACTNHKNVPAVGLSIVAVIMTVQVLLTMSPSASEQFGKIASIAVILTLLPYIYSAVAVKMIGRDKLSAKQNTVYTVIGLLAAFYSMAAMIGSDPTQTRWALMFGVATVIFYQLAETRRFAHQNGGEKSKCPMPSWISGLTLMMTVAALIASFWVSFADEDHWIHRTKSHFRIVEHEDLRH
jgi:arginine:agmatine antiporter